jgi:hypothetical protein
VTWTNSAGQFVTEQHLGYHASVNLIYYPVQNFKIGVEGIWGERVNIDGGKATDQRVGASAVYTF